jgi:hypothetical protein
MTRAICWNPAITHSHPKVVTCWLDEGCPRAASLEDLQVDGAAVPVGGPRNTCESAWS